MVLRNTIDGYSGNANNVLGFAYFSFPIHNSYYNKHSNWSNLSANKEAFQFTSNQKRVLLVICNTISGIVVLGYTF